MKGKIITITMICLHYNIRGRRFPLFYSHLFHHCQKPRKKERNLSLCIYIEETEKIKMTEFCRKVNIDENLYHLSKLTWSAITLHTYDSIPLLSSHTFPCHICTYERFLEPKDRWDLGLPLVMRSREVYS